LDAGINHFVETPGKEWFETQAVLRVSFGNFAFFSIFALIMIGVKHQNDMRDSWHHGGWMIKFILWAVSIGLAFLLPNGFLNAYGASSFLCLVVVSLKLFCGFSASPTTTSLWPVGVTLPIFKESLCIPNYENARGCTLAVMVCITHDVISSWLA
jgi:hypothetical protein